MRDLYEDCDQCGEPATHWYVYNDEGIFDFQMWRCDRHKPEDPRYSNFLYESLQEAEVARIKEKL
jgi:hypothetical protein